MANTQLKLIPLGGLGEIGKNMMVLEWGDDIVVVDCGILFPGEDAPGVDIAIPNISYLLERRHKVRAILITHGHEDHTGALPFVLPQLNVPVYAPRLAQGLIKVKLRDYGLLRDSDLRLIEEGKPFQVGPFEVEAFRVSHSIPDAFGLAIRTPAGLVVHTGDFKIDYTPVDGSITDLRALGRFGEEGVLALLSDSTYAETEGYTPSEQIVGDTLMKAIGEAPARVLVATFASLISRIQLVLDAAEAHGRKVAVAGRRMVDNVAMASEMGYIKSSPGVLVSLQRAAQLPPEQVVLITTGSQGEPSSALVRIARDDHRQIRILPKDTVIISASAIPGNEKVVNRTINNLVRRGARVLYDRIATVHVHGHAAREELKTVLTLTKPRFFIPVHGEFRGLAAHAALAEQMGVKENNAFLLQDGDVLELSESGGRRLDETKAGNVYLDGLNPIDPDSPVLEDRRTLAKDGVVIIVVSIDRETGVPVEKPAVVSSGFTDDARREQVFSRMASDILDSLDRQATYPVDVSYITQNVKKIARRLLYKDMGRRPMIVPVTLEV